MSVSPRLSAHWPAARKSAMALLSRLVPLAALLLAAGIATRLAHTQTPPGGTPYRDWLHSELWLNPLAAGGPPQPLTFFNQPGHPQFRSERVVVADHAWSPDGHEIAVYLQLFESGRHELQILRFAPR